MSERDERWSEIDVVRLADWIVGQDERAGLKPSDRLGIRRSLEALFASDSIDESLQHYMAGVWQLCLHEGEDLPYSSVRYLTRMPPVPADWVLICPPVGALDMGEGFVPQQRELAVPPPNWAPEGQEARA